MSWIIILWSMNAAACLTLAGIYLLVWCRQRTDWAYFVLSCSAVAGAALTAFELALLEAQSAEDYAVILRWAQLPVWAVVVSVVIFVRLYLRAGRLWLAWSVCGMRTLALILNFVFTPNLSYRQITRLKQVPWWGGQSVSVPVGVTNPWILVAQLSLVLLIIFFVDATVTAWRRGDRQRALVVGGALIFFSAIAIGQVVLVVWGIIQVPFLACFSYLGLIAAMGYELSIDMLHRAKLARELAASEADLQETRERMELAANAADLGMWMWDVARDDIWITDKGRMLFGWGASEKLDLDRFKNVLHPEDRERVLEAIENTLRTGAEYAAEYRVMLPEGQPRWVAGWGQVEFDRDGHPVRMRGAALDITKRKQAEEQFRLVVEAAPSAMIMVNTDGCITLVNTQAEAVFGYDRQELIGRCIETLVPERFRCHHAEYRNGYLGNARARPMGAERELFGLRKDGTEVPIEIGLNPIQTAEGLLVLASITDISERKQAELEAARQRSELAHLSRVTTLGELSGSLAHELNLPLGAILSNAQAAQRMLANGGIDVAEFREILNEIVSENKRAAEVIRRLRLWLQKGEVQHQSLRINRVVRDVLKLIRTDLISQNVSVDTELARNLPAVTGDGVQLQQVLVNLVVNGCDAMANCDTRERRLLVRTGVENGGSAVIVSVTDQGGSVPEEKMEQIFEPFFTTKEKGMGLGLSVCRTIIAAHRGKLWATNNADRGATFHLMLPVDVPDKPRNDH
ncbi:MAG TPA: PAS domain S-box protein [Candidatus Udaeobacter sp.]|nr:PAS domain S-box protein [Candidatus Udaeobacter sp.]